MRSCPACGRACDGCVDPLCGEVPCTLCEGGQRDPRKRGVLLATLRDLADVKDAESAHGAADAALLNYIDDLEVRNAFMAVKRWYS